MLALLLSLLLGSGLFLGFALFAGCFLLVGLLLSGLALQLCLNRLVDSLRLFAGGYRCLLVGWVGDDAHVIQAVDALHVAQPYFLAVFHVVGALIRYAVLGVLVVVREGEAHAGDVAALDQFQRVVGIVRLGEFTAAVDAVAAHLQFQGVALGVVAVTAQHVHHVAVVVQVENHVGLLEQFAADAARFQHLIDLAGARPRCQVHRANAEDDGATLNLAALRLSLLWLAQLQAAGLDGDESCLFHILIVE